MCCSYPLLKLNSPSPYTPNASHSTIPTVQQPRSTTYCNTQPCFLLRHQSPTLHRRQPRPKPISSTFSPGFLKVIRSCYPKLSQSCQELWSKVVENLTKVSRSATAIGLSEFGANLQHTTLAAVPESLIHSTRSQAAQWWEVFRRRLACQHIASHRGRAGRRTCTRASLCGCVARVLGFRITIDLGLSSATRYRLQAND